MVWVGCLEGGLDRVRRGETGCDRVILDEIGWDRVGGVRMGVA